MGGVSVVKTSFFGIIGVVGRELSTGTMPLRLPVKGRS